jgi:hypothetical protein
VEWSSGNSKRSQHLRRKRQATAGRRGKLARDHSIRVGGFIDWLDGFIDMQAHVLNAFATAVSNDNIR